MGKITIGDNVRIGTNAVVHKNVPSNSVVVSSPQIIINKDSGLDNKFYTFDEAWLYFDKGQYIKVSDIDVLRKLNR